MAKGEKTGGRKKGTPNKLNATVKEMILEALSEAGGKDYLLIQSKDNPTAFMTLVGKVLPVDVQPLDQDGNKSDGFKLIVEHVSKQ